MRAVVVATILRSRVVHSGQVQHEPMSTLLSAFHARLRQIVTAVAILVLASIGWLAVRVYREYGPLPVREAPAKVRLPFPSGVKTVAFSPDGRRLVAGGRSGVTVWERSTGRVAWEWTQNRFAIRAASYSPDGGRLAVLCQDGHLTLRDADTGETRLICQPGEPDPPAVFIEPDTDTSTRSASSAGFSPDGGGWPPGTTTAHIRTVSRGRCEFGRWRPGDGCGHWRPRSG